MARFLSGPLLAAALATGCASLGAAQDGTSTLQFFCGDVSVSMAGFGGQSMNSATPLIGACVGTLGDHELRVRRNRISFAGVEYDIRAENSVVFQEVALGDVEWRGWTLEVDGTRIAAQSPIPALEAAVAAGDLDAQVVLARAYLNADYVDEDAARAVELFLAAAEAGHPAAQAALAYRYFRGEGVETDETEAMRWAEAAAAQGEPLAQRLLGFGLFNARGTERDIARALENWSAAADAGDALSAFNMGTVIEAGEWVTFNREAAIAWFELAEELGHEEAAGRLEALRE